MGQAEEIPRPRKQSEYELFFATSNAKKGWADLRAVRLSGLVDAWDFLTRKGELAKVVRNGTSHDRWQLKLSLKDGARIWYFVIEKCVFIENVFTSHPNKTK
jgi:hypothetical protein